MVRNKYNIPLEAERLKGRGQEHLPVWFISNSSGIVTGYIILRQRAWEVLLDWDTHPKLDDDLSQEEIYMTFHMEGVPSFNACRQEIELWIQNNGRFSGHT